MKICLVGGIFDREEKVRSKHLITPETVLLDGFQRAGVDVTAVGHAKFVPSDEYDIIHVHHFGKAAMKMATSSCRARFIFTGHNGLIPTGYERSWLRRRAFRYVVDKCNAYVALSHAEERYYESHGAAGKVHCVPNGIPANVFQAPAPSDKDANKSWYDVLYVGQLIDWKGVNFLLEALERLRRQRDVRLRLVYHNALLEPELRKQANDLGIANAVEFVGIMGPSELAEEYRKTDLLVLPSFADCLPSVVTEAFLCGTPVVAGAVCGVPEQVDQFGYVVPPGNTMALADAMERVLSERPRYHALAGAMREYAEQKYNPTAMVEGHLALYQHMLTPESGMTTRQAFWIDPLVRLAIHAYWSRAKRSACIGELR